MVKKMRIMVWSLLAGIGSIALCGAMETRPAVPSPGVALLVVDIQNFYFEGGKSQLSGSVEAGLQAKALIEKFRMLQQPVIYVQHLPVGKESYNSAVDDPQYAIRSNITPLPGEKIFIKHEVNSFLNTGLLDYLRQNNIKRLVICGMQTHMCVEAATRAAVDFGFDVTLVADACATRNLKYKDREIPAETVHATILAVLSGSYARVVSTAELLAEMK